MSELASRLETGFEWVRSKEIESLNIRVEEYNHIVTGAKHYHLAADNRENVFMVAFRTVPSDSTGVAHILEHTTLCGSEKYPVRDPFFLMIRRSLNTFMNAFTASDYTAYPFASENHQDFNNLLDIYLDAVFFPLLDPLDFAQEGHRLEFAEPDNPDSDLVYKGIVYNEMKGDQSSIVSLLYETIKAELFPTSTYHHNSGGDPREIPNLTYEQLVAFHQRHYHPSNAIFMTFGDISAEVHQAKIESQALARFEADTHLVSVKPELPILSPRHASAPYPVSEIRDRQSHVVIGWKLGLNTNLEELIKCNLLSDVLLDTSASPLRLVLENTELASAPSPLCGLEESNYELSFFCGLEGANQEDAEAIEALVLSTLHDVVAQGVKPEQVEACLHQLELSHREIGGDGYPYGLQLMFSCLTAAVHRSDPLALLELDTVLTKLRTEIQDPQFIPGLIKTYLIDNPHRVRLTLYPDAQFAEREQAEVRTELASKREALKTEDVAGLLELTKQLTARQSREEPLQLLPKVGVEDIGAAKKPPKAELYSHPGVSLTEYVAATNGLTYQQVVCDLPALTNSQHPLLQVYSQVVTEIGSGGRNYLETQALQHSQTGGIACYSSLRGLASNPDEFTAKFVMSSRCLEANAANMNQILLDTFYRPAFEEASRVVDLIHQLRIRRDASIANNGHGLAMSAAAAAFRPVAAFNHGIGGLNGVLSLRELDDSLQRGQGIDELMANLAAINERLTEQSKSMAIVTQSFLGDSDDWIARWQSESQSDEIFSYAGLSVPRHQAWLTTTQVNHCAEVFPTVPEAHEDAAPLAVLAGVLRNGYLHRVLREQGGAYGGGATSDQSNGLFRFYSYRDPNVEETFEGFRGAIRWVKEQPVKFDLVEEAILGIVSGIDAPGSPAGEAKQHFQLEQFGRSSEQRRQFRQRVILTTAEDVHRVASEYLSGESATCVITNPERKLDSSFTCFEV